MTTKPARRMIAIANKNATFERTDIRNSILERGPSQGDSGVQGDAEAEDEVNSEGHFWIPFRKMKTLVLVGLGC